ncbi:DUF484 family protein [Klebsiella pneumoniae subsp. pneumoniae]|nr:DUF484 family protein [Klebsiella pneumoniae subsp. pneumoniae]
MPPGRGISRVRIRYAVRFRWCEWHMMRAHNHIHVLEENMSLLMEQAVANGLFPAPAALQTRLAAAESLDDMLQPPSPLGTRRWGWRAPGCACFLTAGASARPRSLPIWH